MKCPYWCAGGHHCNAAMPAGEHVSVPEVWPTSIGQVVATRRQGERRRGWIEIRISVRLPPDELTARRLMRYLIAASHSLFSKIVMRPKRARS